MGWHPVSGALIPANWVGYNEGMFVNILALGSPTHPGPANLWDQWTAPYPAFWRGDGPTRRLAFAPLFGHQYSHIWIDFRGIRDAPMRAAGFDYFENSRRETYANRAWCIANPSGWDGYSKDVWGLTACDGPGSFELPFKGRRRTFFGYAARGPESEPDGRDDGTIAPTAALGSLPFAPEIVIPCADALLKQPRRLPQIWLRRQLQPELPLSPMPRSKQAPSIRSAAGSRPTISASTRGRSCSRRRITATISYGGTCAACRRSAAASSAPDSLAAGSASGSSVPRTAHSPPSMAANEDVGGQPPFARISAECHVVGNDARMEQAALIR